MQCDMCGSGEAVSRVEIEGTELNACKTCSRFGKVKESLYKPKKIVRKHRAHAKAEEIEPTEVIVDNFGSMIKEKRERLSLTQKELAKRIAEKESLLHKIESGHFVPSIELARKLEKFLSIRLIEKYKEADTASTSASRYNELTIGDFIRIRKRN